MWLLKMTATLVCAMGHGDSDNKLCLDNLFVLPLLTGAGVQIKPDIIPAVSQHSLNKIMAFMLNGSVEFRPQTKPRPEHETFIKLFLGALVRAWTIDVCFRIILRCLKLICCNVLSELLPVKSKERFKPSQIQPDSKEVVWPPQLVGGSDLNWFGGQTWTGTTWINTSLLTKVKNQ